MPDPFEQFAVAPRAPQDDPFAAYAAKPPDFRAENAKDEQGNAVVTGAMDAGAGWWDTVSPVPLLKAVSSMTSEEYQRARTAAGKGDYTGAVLHALNAQPITTMGKMLIGIGKAQWDQVEKAWQAGKDGRVSEAAGHSVAAALPVIGPAAAAVAEDAPNVPIMRTVGRAGGLLTPFALKAGMPARTVNVGVKAGPPSNPAEAAAVRFGQSRGVPMDAGTATGSQYLKNVQKSVGSTWGGANTAENAQRAAAEGLTTVADDLARVASRTPASPVSAGESVLQKFDAEIGKFNQQATANYDYIRAAEQQQAGRIAVTGGIKAPATAGKPFTNVPFAVDVADAKAALKGMYDEMMRAKDIAPPMGADARALQALDRLMTGPDSAPLSVVDRALSDLKALDRQYQGPVKEIVKQLDTRVRASAAQAGPKVLKALEDGRAATKQKYAIEGVRDLLSGEPGQVFKQLTANKDVALNRLREVRRIAPQEVENIARAYLEDAFDLATAEGGFAHADRLFANWQKLGPETKRVLFPQPSQIQDLDNFFLLAKKIGQNPNPSGTAATLNATQALAGIPAWAIAKVLYTPRGVRLLTSGVRMSMNPSRAAQATGSAQIARALEMADALPAMAGAPPAATEEARGSR